MIRKMNQHEAMEIADKWKYENEFSFYDMTEDVEDYEEITNEVNRANNYFSVFKDEELYGFFCISIKDRKIELGLGMKPDYTSKGEGIEFVNLILDYLITNYYVDIIKLDVASFNLRAIKVYEKAGFITKERKMVNTNGGCYEFVEMELVNTEIMKK